MINRAIILSALFLCIAVTINWFLSESKEIDDSNILNEPDQYMINAVINRFDSEGMPQHKIAATKFSHSPTTKVTTMKSPALTLRKSKQSTQWKITSLEGRILPPSKHSEEVVELWNEVLAIRHDHGRKFVNITTESLTVYPKRTYAETDKAVSIKNKSSETKAAGMRAFLNPGKFIFYSETSIRVTTTFAPK